MAAVTESSQPNALLTASLALSRCGQSSDLSLLLRQLDSLAWDALATSQRLDLLRVYALAIRRLGPITETQRRTIIQRLDDEFPTGEVRVDRELARLLRAVDAPQLAQRLFAQIAGPISTSEKIHYLFVLAAASRNWDARTRQRFFSHLADVKRGGGGKSYAGYIDGLARKSIEHLPQPELEAIMQEFLAATEDRERQVNDPHLEVVQHWELDELVAAISSDTQQRDYASGRAAFAKAQCFACHRIGGEGGSVGPDLSAIGRRFTARDMLVSIVEPNAEVSDQYRSHRFDLKDGTVHVGRIVNQSGEQWMVNTDMINPGKLTEIAASDVERVSLSSTLMMPSGLIDVLTLQEIRELVAYLCANGDRQHTAYSSGSTATRP